MGDFARRMAEAVLVTGRLDAEAVREHDPGLYREATSAYGSWTQAREAEGFSGRFRNGHRNGDIGETFTHAALSYLAESRKGDLLKPIVRGEQYSLLPEAEASLSPSGMAAYERLAIDLQGVRRLSIRGQEALMVREEDGLHGYYPDFRADLAHSAAWIEVKSGYPDFLVDVWWARYWGSDFGDQIPYTEQPTLFEVRGSSVQDRAVNGPFERCMLESVLSGSAISVDDALLSFIRGKYLSHWDRRAAPPVWRSGRHTLNGSPSLEGITVLHIPGARGRIEMKELDGRAAFHLVLGPDHFSSLCAAADRDAGTRLSDLYGEYLATSREEELRRDVAREAGRLGVPYQRELF